ncbi:MAG: hypothetical protein CM15mP103_02500 [Gammaproteobacteria bacterium]|nr:MAG: hypothetical protein CM15mP103_02500 [Gammaproteobacteria bacterium]
MGFCLSQEFVLPSRCSNAGDILVDQQGIVRHQVVNDEPLGRSVDEVIRILDALQFFEEHGQVCPAGWNKGDAGMVTTQWGVSSYLSEQGLRCRYLWLSHCGGNDVRHRKILEGVGYLLLASTASAVPVIVLISAGWEFFW